MATFESVLAQALTACELALSDILSAHAEGSDIDTRTLKEVSAAVKDLNAVAPSSAGSSGYTVLLQGDGALLAR